MKKQRRNQAPLFNSEHLLSKAKPELVGSGFNLCVQLSHSINWDSISQFLDWHSSNFVDTDVLANVRARAREKMFTSLEKFNMSNKINPTDFWPQILESIANGESLFSAINHTGFPSYAWARLKLREDPQLRRQYDQAIEDRADRLAEQLIELADQKIPDGLDSSGQSTWVQHQRLRVDTRKWIASKLKPRTYGDRIDVSVTDNRISVLGALEQAQQRVAIGMSKDANVLKDELNNPRLLFHPPNDACKSS